MNSPDRGCRLLLYGLNCQKAEHRRAVRTFASLRINQLVVGWSQCAVIALIVLTLQGCDRIFRADEDQTLISEETLTRERQQQDNFNVRRNLSGFGQMSDGVVIDRDIAARPVGAFDQVRVDEELLELYRLIAQQATAVSQDDFHKIEDLERRNRDGIALGWWLDQEAQAYPASAADIEDLKRELVADGKVQNAAGSVTINVLVKTGYLSNAVLDDFERENPKIRARIFCLDTADEMLQLLQTEADLQKKFNAASSPHAFDIAMPSDSAVATLAAKGWLTPITDMSTRGREAFNRNMALVDSDFRCWLSRQGSSVKVDLNRYCIPYCWSLTGIAYNSAFIDEPPLSWAALLNPGDFPIDSLGKLYRRTSMLREPRLTIETALLYLANMPIQFPNLGTIESAARLLTDSATICKGLPDITGDPEGGYLVADLNQFMNTLQAPLGQNEEEMAKTLSRIQDEINWLLLKLDAKQASGLAVAPPSSSLETKGQSALPLAPAQPPSTTPNPVLHSMRSLALITNDDLRSAVSFLKELADIEHRLQLLLGQSNSIQSDYVREIKIIQAALLTIKNSLNSGRLDRPEEIAAGFSSAQRRADALLDTLNGVNPEAKFEIAIDLLFRGPGTSDVQKTANNVSLLMEQGNSQAGPETPEDQSEVMVALSYLEALNSYVSYFLTPAETVKALQSDKVILAQATGSDAARAALKNENIAFALPREGVLGTADCFVILKDTNSSARRNIGACRTFLNYLLMPQNAAKMANYSKYASTESASATFVDRAVLNGASYFHPSDLAMVRLLPAANDKTDKIYVQASAPPVPSSVLPGHPELKEARSLFGVLFQRRRPN